jgi:hypothetical protein
MPDDGFGVIAPACFLRTAQEPGDQFLIVCRQLQDNIELLLSLGQDRIEVVHLRRGPGIAVKQEAAVNVVLAESVPDHFVSDTVRNEVPVIHVLAGFDAQRRPTPNVGAEDVAGGDGNNAEAFRNAFRLGSLAGTGRSNNQHSRHVNVPSWCRCSRSSVSVKQNTTAGGPAVVPCLFVLLPVAMVQ